MGSPTITSSVRFTPARESDRERGLIAYVRCVFAGQIVVDGITVRRRRDGGIVLSFPEREDGLGRRHPVIRPIDDEARRAIEATVLGAIGSEAWS